MAGLTNTASPRATQSWHLGQSDLDALIAHAHRSCETLAVDLGKPVCRVSIGGRPVGLLAPNGLDVIRWPAIAEVPIPFYDLDRMHAAADSDHRGVCYFIGGDSGAIKIGFSTDLKARFASIQACSPVLLSVLATAPGGKTREEAYHLQFADDRLHGEWFARTPALLAEIARLQPTPSLASGPCAFGVAA